MVGITKTFCALYYQNISFFDQVLYTCASLALPCHSGMRCETSGAPEVGCGEHMRVGQVGG